MNDFINWCVRHWQFLSTLVLSLASLLVLILKPRTKSNMWSEILYNMCTHIPGWIWLAEDLLVSGSTKKDFVITQALEFVKKQLHRSLTDLEIAEIKQQASNSIEGVLACPTKKGGLGRER